VAGQRDHKGALLVLTAEQTLIQAGINADSVGDDRRGKWDSNILRNTEKVALLIAAKANKLIIEAELLTRTPKIAESLASVARGLLSLAAFNDNMDAEMIAMMNDTEVVAKDKSLKLSLAVDSELVVATLGD
jgi:hypothetical protein